jgi:hypothetical protein
MATGEATGKRCFADSMPIMPSHPGLFDDNRHSLIQALASYGVGTKQG